MYSANLATAQRNGYGFEHGSAYSESVIVKSKDLEEQVREPNSENRHLVNFRRYNYVFMLCFIEKLCITTYCSNKKDLTTSLSTMLI